MSAALEISGLGFDYGARRALAGVSFEVQAGEVVAVVGPNGAGKSTLLKVCAGLRPGHAGTVLLGGAPPPAGGARAALVAYVAQEPPASLDLRAGELVLTGLVPALGAWSAGGAAGLAKAEAAMRSTGTLELADRPLWTLSGGELRRVLVARALLRAPKLLLLDEPLASLDLGAQGQVLALIQLAAARGAGVLVALHDLNVARRSFRRALLIVGGRLAGDGPPAEVLSEASVRSAFGEAEVDGGYFFPRTGPRGSA